MQMTFIFVLISVTLKMFQALELKILTCNVKQLDLKQVRFEILVELTKIQGVGSDFWSPGLTPTLFHSMEIGALGNERI